MNKLAKPEDYPFVFEPLNDITSYELALVFAAVGIRLSTVALKKLPPEFKRHFRKDTLPVPTDIPLNNLN